MARQVVVVGAGVGGLSAAIHARLAGYDVLVLEQHAQVGGKAAGIQQAGFRLDPGPSIVILTRLYRDLFARAGRQVEDYLQFERLDPITRVYFGGEPPLDLPAEPTACFSLLKSVAPQDAEAFERMFDKLAAVTAHIDRSIFSHPYTKPWQLLDPHLIATALRFDVRASYKQLVDQMFRSPLLRAFFYGFPSYGGQSYHSKAAGALMIPYLMLAEGVWYPKGGVAAIPAALEKLAIELGVTIRTGAQVVGFELEGPRVKAAKLVSDERVQADAFVGNVDPLSLAPLLGRPKPELEPSYSYFTVHWGVKGSFPELRHHTLYVPENFEEGFDDLYLRGQFPRNPIVYLNATSAMDPLVAPPNHENLFAVITSPAEVTGIDWLREEPELIDRTRKVLARGGLSWPAEAECFQRVQSPPYFTARHGNYRGSLYGAHERHRVFGLFPHPNQDPQLQNLFYVGGGVQPGAGLPMVTLSGMFVGELLRKWRG